VSRHCRQNPMPTSPSFKLERTRIRPKFDDQDPFADEEGLLCPHCNSCSSLTIENTNTSNGPHCVDVVAGFLCSNCSNRFWICLTKTESGEIVFEFAKPVVEQNEEQKLKRKSIKPSLRFQILKRDNYRCQMCGVTAKDGTTLEIDHITPVSKGGSNDASNLQALCRDCNAGKSDSLQ
jgi:5-methylcytosine-specific restriction endonuclease McrA